MPTVFLHIGTPKSGTTYLQSRMNANRDNARSQGLLWPGPRWERQLHAVNRLRSVGKKDRLAPENPWAELAVEAKAWRGGAVLISMERLCCCTPHQIELVAESLAPCRIEVVCTVRDFARAFTGQWQEMTQQYREWAWAQFCREMQAGKRSGAASRRFWEQHDVPVILRRWMRVVPKEQVHVVTVPPSGSEPDLLWRRFCTALQLDGSGFRPGRASNESLGVVSAQLMHRVNVSAHASGVESSQYRRVLHRRLARRVLASRRSREPRLQVPERMHDWVRTQAETLVKQIGALDVPVVGSLDELVPDTLGTGDPEPDDIPAEDLLEVAVDALVALGADYDAELQSRRGARR